MTAVLDRTGAAALGPELVLEPEPLGDGDRGDRGARRGGGRRRRVLARAAVVAVCVGLLAAGAVVATVSSTRFATDAPIRFGAGVEAATLPGYEGGTHLLLYRHGEEISFTFPLVNEGQVPVTVTGLDLDAEARALLEPVRVELDGHALPASVGPGERAEVHVVARYANCRYYHEREVELVAGAAVRGRVLGLGITRSVAFDHPLVIHSPMIVDCPDRTLVRDDDVRRSG